MSRIEVPFPVSADRAHAYLVDPRNRPEWQSSLRAVADVAPDLSTWTDITAVPGVRPRMRTTVSEPPYRWVEEGDFGRFHALLELRFVATGTEECTVSADFAVRGFGLGRLLTAGAGPAVAADLRSAARILTQA